MTPDGKTLLAGGHAPKSTELKLIDLDTGKQLATLRDTIPKGFSQDGRLLATRELAARDVVTVRHASTGRRPSRS